MTFDPIDHPEHYNTHPSGIETIEITQHETFLRGNILKYVLRAPYKGSELSDLRKARAYLDREIKRVEATAAVAPPLRPPTLILTPRPTTPTDHPHD